MVAPLLHTRVRESVEIALAPEQVLAQLKLLASEQFSMTVDASDSDNITFEMLRQRETIPDIKISGLIRRWQGTEARLDFKGEVNALAPNSRVQNIRLALILIIATLLYGLVILPQHNRFSVILDTQTFYIMALITFVVYLVVIYQLSKTLILNSTSDKQRWQLQQEMAHIVEKIRKLQSDAQ